LARAAAHGTEEKRQGEKTGLRQAKYDNKARGQGRGGSVGLQGGHRFNARQVFDETLSKRARSSEIEGKEIMPGACSGRFKYIYESLMVTLHK
jgi:hypothetical protein